VTIADLIGEIDLVKHAEGRYLSDESTMHYGLIPRASRGYWKLMTVPSGFATIFVFRLPRTVSS
jgi:magnesium chelatase subunit I